MRGENFLIIPKILKNEKNPIKESIGEKTPEKIVEVIMREYWKEWRYKLDYSHSNNIVVENLGSFYTTLSGLKGYTRRLIKRIRKIRVTLEQAKKRPDFNPYNSKSIVIEQDLIRKLKACWSQIEERRKLMIMRYLRYNERCRKNKTPEKIKYNYEWYDFKFLDAYGYNSVKFPEYPINQ